MRLRVAAGLAIVLLGAAAARGQEAVPTPPPAARMRFGFLVGWEEWPALGDLVPPPVLAGAPVVGAIESGGFLIDFTAHWTVRRHARHEFLVGVEGGLFFHANTQSFVGIVQPDGGTFAGRVDARGLYVGPGIRWIWTRSPKVRPYVGLLAGFYVVDAAVVYEEGSEGENYPDRTALGGQVTGGLEFPVGNPPGAMAVRLEARIRYAALGQLPAFGADAGSMSGPAYGLLVGFGVQY